MGEISEPEPWRAFRVRVDYTDTELVAYQRIAVRAATYPDPPYVGWGVYGTGMALALVVSRLAAEIGFVDPRDQGILALVVGIAFLIGLWSPSMWRTRASRKHEQDYRSRIARAARGLEVLFASNGLMFRMPGLRMFYANSAFRGATVEGELMLFWAPEEVDTSPILILPLRLLSAEQQAAIAARWPPVRAGSP